MKSPGRLMGLDVGSKTIGVSLSDPMRVTTSPLTTLQRTSIDTDCEQLLEIANHHMVAGIVIGLPRNMDGSRSETERLIPPILKYLRLSNIDVDLQDERLSTKAAEKKMAQEKLPISERQRRKNEFAAAIILEWYIQEL